jgi:4'-phosphopantetheinyl transferase EntD
MSPQSIVAAPQVAALFAHGVIAYQTREAISADTLLPQERETLQRAVPKRIHEFAAGRACARTALSKLGYPAAPLLMCANRTPIWPTGATGSITHTEDYCAAVVASRHQLRALGLDAEPAGRVKPELWHRICTPEELAILQGQDAAAAMAAATVLFSAKEAFYKCQYMLTGEWLGFMDIRVSLHADRFTVQPMRSLQIATQIAGPWEGRYLQEAGFVITGLCIV